MYQDHGDLIFADRDEAGQALAEELAYHVPAGTRPLVLALPRGGVPVAVPVADVLGGDLDIVVARKIGAPDHPEFGVGAIAEDGPPVFAPDSLAHLGLTPSDLSSTVTTERAELARRIHEYRGSRAAPDPAGRTVVLVDDGLATGVTAYAALQWIRGRRPARVILAVPVSAPQPPDAFTGYADKVVCLSAPPRFRAVGQWYQNFPQLTDADVDRLLQR